MSPSFFSCSFSFFWPWHANSVFHLPPSLPLTPSISLSLFLRWHYLLFMPSLMWLLFLFPSQREERAKTAYNLFLLCERTPKWAFDFVVSQSAMSSSLKCDRMLISKGEMLHCLRGLRRPLSPNESFIWLDESWVLWENILNVLTPSSFAHWNMNWILMMMPVGDFDELYEMLASDRND